MMSEGMSDMGGMQGKKMTPEMQRMHKEMMAAREQMKAGCQRMHELHMRMMQSSAQGVSPKKAMKGAAAPANLLGDKSGD